MNRSDKLAIAFGIVFEVLAVFFTAAVVTQFLTNGTSPNPAFKIGAILFQVYGYSSILIPLFLLTAGIFLFAGKTSIRWSVYLISSLVPFLSVVIAEKMAVNFIKNDTSALMGFKVAVVFVVCALLIAIEYLLIGMLADYIAIRQLEKAQKKQEEPEADDDDDIPPTAFSNVFPPTAALAQQAAAEAREKAASPVAVDDSSNEESELDKDFTPFTGIINTEPTPVAAAAPLAVKQPVSSEEDDQPSSLEAVANAVSAAVAGKREKMPSFTIPKFVSYREQIAQKNDAWKEYSSIGDYIRKPFPPIGKTIIELAERSEELEQDQEQVKEQVPGGEAQVCQPSVENEEPVESPIFVNFKRITVPDMPIIPDETAEPAVLSSSKIDEPKLDEPEIDTPDFTEEANIDSEEMIESNDDTEEFEAEENEESAETADENADVAEESAAESEEELGVLYPETNEVFESAKAALEASGAFNIPRKPFNAETAFEPLEAETADEPEEVEEAEEIPELPEAEELTNADEAAFLADPFDDNAEESSDEKEEPVLEERVQAPKTYSDISSFAEEDPEPESESEQAENVFCVADLSEDSEEPEEVQAPLPPESFEEPDGNSGFMALAEKKLQKSAPVASVSKSYSVPAEGLLDTYPDGQYWIIDDETQRSAGVLKETLSEFKIEADVTGIRKGPVITMFEILPAPGVKLNRIVALQDNIALRLAASSVRIVAPIPGKHAVGIEVPNKERAIVSFRELIDNDSPLFKKMEIPVVLGKDITGEAKLLDLAATPHLLIAGSTGSGKSVCVNTMILSILYKRSPQQVKMILIDPKIVELKLYNDIPHLLTPVITEPKKAFQALQYCLCEMERRYAMLDHMGVRDIKSYNRRIEERNICNEKLPYIVVVIDEFADLMATTGKELESTVARLAAMSRAVGIHIVLATQRPSIDVITGLIKANIPTRIAFMVASKMDSRIIIDQVGAEKLLGKGDMLYASAVDPFPVRIQGTFVSETEVEKVVEYVKQFGEPEYIDEEMFFEEEEDDSEQSLFSDGDDPLYEKALEIVLQAGKASASYIQRRLKIGYNRAARLVEEMEARGIVGPANGSKPRDVIHVPSRSSSTISSNIEP